ncbi:Putative rossmann-like alpha/beta/alpha sandwich protein [Septoria linicola]|uniref:Rossmann-like alpha/beta/alpha sandwich protein n=1 Tax=Septoria linicola TaxID=215465 RepID=A0A9Q9AWK8_9PEZI|nr:Putative rossmann-like alpha/beta/alpha sandwich protein [Septoria linicola]
MTEVKQFVESSDICKTTDLVLVCCHGIYMGEDGRNTAEDQWILQPFSRSDPLARKPGEHETFIAHIMTAAMAVHSNPEALLIFSGGFTTNAPRSEAESYAIVLKHMVNHNAALFPAGVRYALETYATDSYQNLIFSIIRFRQLTGAYPKNITVVTHAFKERRFLELHAPAIKWPHHRIRVQGLNPPFTLDELNFTQMGERERAYNAFAGDPYGVRMPLSQKRLARNWNAERAHVFLGFRLESEVTGLLGWQGGVSGWETYPRRLPWEDDSTKWMYEQRRT